MKVTCNPAALQSAVMMGRRIISRHNALPALACVLLTANMDGGLTVEADNLEARARRSILAGVDEPGMVALRVDALHAALGAFDGEMVTLEAGPIDKHIARLTADGATLTVRGVAVDDFPSERAFEAAGEVSSLDTRAFRRLVESVATSVAPDCARPILEGIKLEATGDRLAAIAADGFRLAKVSASLAAPATFEALVPGRLLLAAARSLARDAFVTIEPLVEAIRLSDGLSTWTVRQIIGQFPDYGRILPTSYKTIATCRTRDLRRAATVAQRIGKLGGNMAAYITRLTIGDGRIVVQVGRADAGNLAAELTIQADVAGAPLMVALSARYLVDALASIGSEQVAIKVNTPASPVVVEPVGSGDTLHAVMPMHVAP